MSEEGIYSQVDITTFDDRREFVITYGDTPMVKTIKYHDPRKEEEMHVFRDGVWVTTRGEKIDSCDICAMPIRKRQDRWTHDHTGLYRCDPEDFVARPEKRMD